MFNFKVKAFLRGACSQTLLEGAYEVHYTTTAAEYDQTSLSFRPPKCFTILHLCM